MTPAARISPMAINASGPSVELTDDGFTSPKSHKVAPHAAPPTNNTDMKINPSLSKNAPRIVRQWRML
jgi:hypothetical protein